MQKQSVNHFGTAKKDFAQLKQNKQIPPQMEVKLDYLLSKIQKQNVPKEVSDALPEYEINSLDSLTKETGIQLFCNIVNCLSGKQIVLYFRDEKIYMRKDDLFAIWKTCYMTCDSNTISIAKKIGQKPIQTFELAHLRVSKNFKLYKKKNVFGACYNKKKSYLIGFDLQSTCTRIHELLRSLIRQKVRKLTKATSTQKSQGEITQLSISKCLQPASMQESRTIQQTNVEQVQEEEVDEDTDMGVVVEFIKQEEINGDSMYKLLKTDGNIRHLVHKNYPNKLRTEIVIPKTKTNTSVFDHYLKLSEWNPEIEECKIKIKLSENSYILQIKVKKYSYISWPRCSVILATGLIYRNNYFLVLRSTGEDSGYTDTVKMEWSQIVQIHESEDKLLLSFISELDFKGYSSLEDSQRMALKVLDYTLLLKYIEARQISTKVPALFNLSVIKKTKSKQIQKLTSINEKLTSSLIFSGKDSSSLNDSPEKNTRKLSQHSQFDVADDLQSNRQQFSQINDTPEKSKSQNIISNVNSHKFTDLMMKNGDSKINEEIIPEIRIRTHERYYLKKYFDKEVHPEPHKNQYCADESNNYIFQNGNWKLNEEGDLVFINEKVMEMQKDVIKLIVKQLGSNIMYGKSIMNMSLPVEVFDFRSILQRVAIGFGYAPKFLIPAGETESLLEQAKFVTLFILGIAPLHVSFSKPFNPILGQTFQCLIGGIPIDFEQVSHHPPISAFYMKTQNLTFHGAFHSHADMGLNRVTGRNLGSIYMQFPKTNTFYEIKLPEMEISGLIHGDKKYRGIGKGYIHERTNNLFVEWSIGKDKKKIYQAEGKVKSNDIYGGIYTVTTNFGKKFKECENKQKFDGLKNDDVIEKHVKITGDWCFDVFFNDEKVKSVDEPLPNKLQYPEYVLPSDSNFRLDLIYKRMQNLKASNEEKQVLQNIQRHDRKLREGKIKNK